MNDPVLIISPIEALCRVARKEWLKGNLDLAISVADQISKIDQNAS